MFCLTLALACGTLFLYSEKGNLNLTLFCIGVISACVFILKQNFGLAIFVTNIIFFLSQKKYRNTTSFLWYSIGYSLVILVQLGYFISTESLNAYIKDFYDYTIVKIFMHGILNSALPWQYPAPLFVKSIKLLLYLSPLITCITTIIIMIKKKIVSPLFYFPLVGISFYLLSIRPTTDFIHLTPLIALSLIPLSIFYQETIPIRQKGFILGIIVLCFCAGLYSAFFRNYYRWNTPLIKQKAYLNNPTLKIFTDEKEKESITQIIAYYAKNAKDEKYTFIYYFTPIYYVLIDKKNPTSYDDLQLGGVSDEDQKEIITTLQGKKVNHILTDTNLAPDKSLIATFIKEKYVPVKQVNEYTIWQRKD